MKCTCEKWNIKINKEQKLYVAGEIITHCPYCGLKLIKDDFRVYITYDGPEDKAKEKSIKIALEPHVSIKILGKKKLYFDLQLS